jgi:hypothetical protein
MYAHLTRVLAALMIALGATMIVRTAVHGFGVGILLGLLFVVAGIGRLYMARRRG